MKQKLISIQVGNRVTRICEIIKKSGKSIQVANAYETETPEGTVEDGTILEAARLADTIKKSIYGRKGIKANQIVFSISSKKIVNKEIVIPFMKKAASIQEMLNLNAQEYFPMSNVEAYSYAYSVAEIMQESQKKEMRLSAIAVPKELIESYYELAKELKMTIEDIDYIGNSVNQLLKLQMDERTQMVLQIEKHNTYINVMSGSTVLMQRSVPYGMDAVIAAFMDSKKITEKEARHLVQSPEMIEQTLTQAEYEEAMRFLVGSISRVVEFHTSRHPDSVIEEVNVFGEGSMISGIDQLLEEHLGVTVNRFEELKGVLMRGKGQMNIDETLRFLSNIGAVLHPVGLKHSHTKEGSKVNSGKLIVGGIIGAGVLALALSVTVIVFYFILKEDKLELENNIAAIADIEQTESEFKTAREQYDLVQSFYEGTKNDNEALYTFLNDCEEIMPSAVEFTNVTAASGAVTISALSAGKEPIAKLVIEIKKLPYVSGVFVDTISETISETGEVTDVFNISCMITNIEGVQADEAE